MQAVWDQRYRHHGHIAKNDGWLDRWRKLLPHHQSTILNLGCGDGIDSQILSDWGYQTLSVDWSPEALKLTRQRISHTHLARVDFRNGLPFLPNTLSTIIASLSLHYFDTTVTQNIINDIHRCLTPQGHLIARFNSTQDINYGAQGHPQIEPDVYLVDGQQKRFFTQQSTEALFDTHWQIHNLEERSINHYAHPKIVWEVIAIA